MVSTLFYFILALLLLIIVHEYGHFIVARWCGVKVLRFSFGFGKVLCRWHDKKGTEYAWSLFPLGGYIKMLDETEEAVPVQERHLAFNNKPLWMRVAIILAGPLFNFLFAAVAFWLVLVIGIKSLAPIIEDVKPHSVAARAGLSAKQEILTFNGEKITSWHDFEYACLPLIGLNESVSMTVKSLSTDQQKNVMLTLVNWQPDVKKPDLLSALGIVPFIPTIPPVVGEVLADSPAQKTGLNVNDEIRSINGQLITDWLDMVDFVKLHPDQHTIITIKRNGNIKQLPAIIGHVMNNGHIEGMLGMRSKAVDWPEHWLRVKRENPLQAVPLALKQTLDLTTTSFALIGRLLTGKISLHNMSGPVGIAQGAGESAKSGFVYYLSFLALISISLGVLNLLPIPMLDGGHLFYYVIELICRRQLPAQVKMIGMYIGLIVLVALSIIALSNDLTRLGVTG
jgi:regulator of sigma E protease